MSIPTKLRNNFVQCDSHKNGEWIEWQLAFNTNQPEKQS